MQDNRHHVRAVRSLDGFVSANPSPRMKRPGASSQPLAYRQSQSNPGRPVHAAAFQNAPTSPRLSGAQLAQYLKNQDGTQRPRPNGHSLDGLGSSRNSTPIRTRPTHLVAPQNKTLTPLQSPRQASRQPVAPSDDSLDASLHALAYRPVRQTEPAADSERVRRGKRTRKHPRARRFALTASAVMGALVLVAGGWLGWKFFNNTSKVFGGNIISNIGGLVNSTPLKGQETGRVNILLAGDSSDDAGHNGADLTDSIMLISIDTDNNKAFTMSIPRDFWVNIPGVGFRKINEAKYWGMQNEFSENGYPEGGMGLLEKTIESAFLIDINYYALVNYSAFRDMVSSVGGITVNIQSDDPRGLYDPTFQKWEGGPLKLPNGAQQLDGPTALKLARARGHDGGYGYARSDFTRSDNQRRMLIALKEKALSAGVVSNPIKIGNLMDSVGDNVKTDFKLNEITTLVGLGKKISTIDSVSLQSDTNKLLSSYTSPSGQSALIPSAGLGEYSDIVSFLKRHMSNDPVVQEAASVVVLNGTETDGLAKTQETILEAKGITVPSISSASKPYEKTTIIDASKGAKKATKAWLAKTYPGATITTQAAETIPAGTHFVVVLGNDFASKQATTATNGTAQ